MWNPRYGEQLIGRHTYRPVIKDGKVLMWGVYDPEPYKSNIWEWTQQGGLGILATVGWGGVAPYYFDFWGDTLAWSDADSSNIAVWDPIHGKSGLSQVPLQFVSGPLVYGNTIAWMGNHQVYLSTPVPEPSSLLALGGFAGLLLGVRRRKTGE
jgi:hypothetical protein